MSPIEAVAVVFGLAAVLLTVKQNIWCWPLGLVQVALYVYVFYTARLYSDMLLHVAYVGLQIYGWYRWLHPASGHRDKLPVTRLPGSRLAILVVATLLAAYIGGEAMSTFTNAAAAHADAFIAVASLAAQYLLAHKKLETWFFWIVVDVVAIGVYWSQGLALTAGLYAVFLALCVLGLSQWTSSHRRELRGAPLAPNVAP